MKTYLFSLRFFLCALTAFIASGFSAVADDEQVSLGVNYAQSVVRAKRISDGTYIYDPSLDCFGRFDGRRGDANLTEETYRTAYEFSTFYIPDNATITGATLSVPVVTYDNRPSRTRCLIMTSPIGITMQICGMTLERERCTRAVFSPQRTQLPSAVVTPF